MTTDSQAEILIDAIHTALVRIDIWNSCKPVLVQKCDNLIREFLDGSPIRRDDQLVIDIFSLIKKYAEGK